VASNSRDGDLLGKNRAIRASLAANHSPAKPRGRKSSTSGSRSQKLAEARKLPAGEDSEAPSVPRDVKNSFRRGYYSPSTNLDWSEWEVMYRQFVESGLIVKWESASD
jgi:hypothetical protein